MSARTLPSVVSWVGCAALLCAAVAGLYLLWQPRLYPIRHLVLHGELHHITPEAALKAGKSVCKSSFFAQDLSVVRNVFANLPWVASVQVRRKWPDRLEVTLVEHQELAHWGNVGLVSQQGQLFYAATDNILPVFYGPPDSVQEVTAGYMRFGKVLAKTGLGIRQLVLSNRRAWQVVTQQGVVLELGRENTEERLQRFVAAFEQLRTMQHKLAYVDLRYANGFALRLQEGEQG